MKFFPHHLDAKASIISARVFAESGNNGYREYQKSFDKVEERFFHDVELFICSS